MKTVKDVSEITGVSIRTLRYYDEIGLLKPTELTDAGYRLYDNKALERLQEIMFFKELEIPLEDIKKIMDNPNYDKEQALLTQKTLLEQKRNRLNGIIELISDVMKGVNTMSFEAFNDEEVQKILDHILECMSKESLEEQIQKYGNVEKYREHLASGFSNEQAIADVFKWYGCKEKAMKAILQSTGNTEKLKQEQDENAEIYKQFMAAKESGDENAEKEAVEHLAENYKKMFRLDNARNILLDLANEYLKFSKLAEATDIEFGTGCSEYVAYAIQKYYGI
ncbi:MAG: MerR family transcriptional regulator [Lachnospiraceae bacterium]|nr:MerR family transcriptional regulator [Lachnospiraceae bacterium]MDE6252062.1 MerR family transcriptional regulator [Lachnospiraceae bacterium]